MKNSPGIVYETENTEVSYIRQSKQFELLKNVSPGGRGSICLEGQQNPFYYNSQARWGPHLTASGLFTRLINGSVFKVTP